MKLLGGLSALLLLFVLVAVSGAAALPVPNVQFIPEQLSENGSFLMIVDPMVYDKPVRVTWTVPAILDTNIGLFPRDGDKWVCYFSNDDPDATCGPTPFASNLESYDILIKSVDSYGDTGNRSYEDFEVGSIKLTPQLTASGSDVNMLIYPSGGIPKEVLYAVYDSGFDKKIDYTLLTMDPKTGYFTGTASLGAPGTYYFAFKTDDQSESFGGGLMKKQVGIGTGLVSGDIESDSVVLNLLLNKTQVYRNINNQMKNVGESNLTGLAVSVDRLVSDKVSIELEKRTLRPGETGYFTVKLENVENRMDIVTFANVTSNNTVVGQILLSLNVSVLNECAGDGDQCPICPSTGGNFIITPVVWKDDFLLGDSPKKTFQIRNTGDSELIVDLPSPGDLGSAASITTDESIMPGSTGELSIELTPAFAGTYSGVVTVSTNGGSQNILVNANFYEDVSADIIDAKDDLSLLYDTGISSFVLDDIESELTQAEDDLNFGNFRDAAEGFAAASAKVALLTDVVSAGYVPPADSGNGSGGDSSLIIIILVVALVALGGVLLYLKKFRKAGGGLGSDDDIEKELDVDDEGY